MGNDNRRTRHKPRGTAVVGIGKEVIWDKLLNKGTFDKKDLVFDLIGIIIGCL